MAIPIPNIADAFLLFNLLPSVIQEQYKNELSKPNTVCNMISENKVKELSKLKNSIVDILFC